MCGGGQSPPPPTPPPPPAQSQVVPPQAEGVTGVSALGGNRASATAIGTGGTLGETKAPTVKSLLGQ